MNAISLRNYIVTRILQLLRKTISCDALPNIFRELKGPVSWYGKLTWESAHAWNLIILCTFVALGMTTIIMVHLIFYVILLKIYDVIYGITTKSDGTLL